MKNLKTVTMFLTDPTRVQALAKASRVAVEFQNFKPSVVTGSETCVIDFINEYFRGNPVGRYFIKNLKDAEQVQ